MTQGKRTREQRLRSLLSQARTRATEKYTIGGLLKRKSIRPKPISLAKVSLPEEDKNEC